MSFCDKPALITTAKDRVKRTAPSACAKLVRGLGWRIVDDATGKVLGRGTNLPAAWEDAAAKLK